MTADDMANFHEHMAAWCEQWSHETEEAGDKETAIMFVVAARQHNEAFQYWCRQANPGAQPPKDT